MKLKTVILATLCALSLSACACPRPPVYQGEPYSDSERTTGTAHEDQGCFRRTFF